MRLWMQSKNKKKTSSSLSLGLIKPLTGISTLSTSYSRLFSPAGWEAGMPAMEGGERIYCLWFQPNYVFIVLCLTQQVCDIWVTISLTLCKSESIQQLDWVCFILWSYNGVRNPLEYSWVSTDWPLSGLWRPMRPNCTHKNVF